MKINLSPSEINALGFVARYPSHCENTDRVLKSLEGAALQIANCLLGFSSVHEEINTLTNKFKLWAIKRKIDENAEAQSRF